MTEKEFENCKIGDTVICNYDLNHISFLPKKGSKGKIHSKGEKSFKVEWDNNKFSKNWNWFVNSGRYIEDISCIDLYKLEQLEFEF